jgi:hypothetical protein
MMDETMPEDHSRYCPSCAGWVDEGELQVPADGKPRHKLCGTIALPKTNLADGRPQTGMISAPTAEMRELAGRMAADESAEGNFDAAAELKAFAEEQSYRGSNGLLYRGNPDAPTGPLTPGQVMCRVCQLDDRTRAATDPDDLLCTVCHANKPIREEKARRKAFAEGAPAPVPWDHPDADPAADLAAVAKAARKAGLPPTPSLPVVGPAVAKHLVAGGAVEGQDYVVHPPAGAGDAVPEFRVPEPPIVSRNAVRSAFAADLRRLFPQVTGAKLHADHGVALADAFIDAGWVPGARRQAAELPKATAEQVPEPLRSRLTELADPDRYEEQPVEDADGAVIGHVWELQPRHCLEHEREWVAAVDGDSSNRPRFSSRDGAERWVRANALRDGRPLTVPYDAEKVLGLKSEAIGWVWLDPEHAGDDGRWCAVHGGTVANASFHAVIGTPPVSLRDQAIGWVLEQDKAARETAPKLELHPVLVKPGGGSTPCCCQPDACFGEGDAPNACEYCAAIDGELPCPIADAEVDRG